MPSKPVVDFEPPFKKQCSLGKTLVIEGSIPSTVILSFLCFLNMELQQLYLMKISVEWINLCKIFKQIMVLKKDMGT
jgi:hypothetical protein